MITSDFRRRIAQHVAEDPSRWSEQRLLVDDQLAEDRLRDELDHALAKPAVMVTAEPFTWHVALRSGACMVLRFDEQHTYAEDLFFIHSDDTSRDVVDESDDRQSAVMKQLVLRYAPYDADSRHFIIEHAPPGGPNAGGVMTSPPHAPPDTPWFLASLLLLPDNSFPLKEVIGQGRDDEKSARAARGGAALCPAGVSPIVDAYRSLIDFGMGELFGVAVSAPLGVSLVMESERTLLVNLRRWVMQTQRLAIEWRDASTSFRDELRHRTFSHRIEAWVACIALGSAYEAALCEAIPGAERLATLIDQVLDVVDAFDDAIEQNAPLLLKDWSPAQRERSLSMLSAAYRDAKLPWLVCDQS